jgi:hypothetical protein
LQECSHKSSLLDNLLELPGAKERRPSTVLAPQSMAAPPMLSDDDMNQLFAVVPK